MSLFAEFIDTEVQVIAVFFPERKYFDCQVQYFCQDCAVDHVNRWLIDDVYNGQKKHAVGVCRETYLLLLLLLISDTMKHICSSSVTRTVLSPGGRRPASRSPAVRRRSPVTSKGKRRSSSSSTSLPHLHTYTSSPSALRTLIYAPGFASCYLDDHIVSIYYCAVSLRQAGRLLNCQQCAAMNSSNSCRRIANVSIKERSHGCDRTITRCGVPSCPGRYAVIGCKLK